MTNANRQRPKSADGLLWWITTNIAFHEHRLRDWHGRFHSESVTSQRLAMLAMQERSIVELGSIYRGWLEICRLHQRDPERALSEVLPSELVGIVTYLFDADRSHEV